MGWTRGHSDTSELGFQGLKMREPFPPCSICCPQRHAPTDTLKQAQAPALSHPLGLPQTSLPRDPPQGGTQPSVYRGDPAVKGQAQRAPGLGRAPREVVSNKPSPGAGAQEK